MKFSAALLLLMLVATPAMAQENQQPLAELMRRVWAQSKQPNAKTVQQVYSRVIQVDLPRPFVAAFKQVEPGFFIMEYVPDGETLANWTQMITITGNFGVGSANVDDAALASFMFGRAECPGKLFRDAGELAPSVGARQRMLAIGCGGPAAGSTAGERAAIAFLRDADHVWTVQFAQRVGTGGKGKLFEVEQAAARLASLNIQAVPMPASENAAPKP
ncbi:MAG: hypothetical protein WCO82_05570 [Sphingomonadales bacterium]